MHSVSDFELEVADSVQANSAVFLRRAASELVSIGDQGDSAFDQERATVVTAFTQMALELALASFLIRKRGLRSIIQGSDNISDAEMEMKWRDNTLRTKRFEDNKALLEVASPYTYEYFEGAIDDFQQKRNKIVHLYYSFDEADRFDLKYRSAYILIHIVSKLMFGHEDSVNYPERLKRTLTRDVFAKLVRFPPYVLYISRLAEEHSRNVLTCLECEQRTFSDIEMKCFACTFEYPHGRLIECPNCLETAVIYDNLNIHINDSVPARCLNCAQRSLAFHCSECRLDTATFSADDCRYCSQAEPI